MNKDLSDGAPMTAKVGESTLLHRKDMSAADAISERLQKSYQEVKDEPVPDHFLDLLFQLDEAAAKKTDG